MQQSIKASHTTITADGFQYLLLGKPTNTHLLAEKWHIGSGRETVQHCIPAFSIWPLIIVQFWVIVGFTVLHRDPAGEDGSHIIANWFLLCLLLPLFLDFSELNAYIKERSKTIKVSKTSLLPVDLWVCLMAAILAETVDWTRDLQRWKHSAFSEGRLIAQAHTNTHQGATRTPKPLPVSLTIIQPVAL